MALAFSVFVEFARIGTPDDDYAISMALSGVFPESGLCLFVNAALSRFVLVLSGVLPGVNVFVLLLYVLTFVSIGMLLYELLTRSNSLGLAIAIFASVVFLSVPMCTFVDNFSNVSALCTMVGGSLVIVEATEEGPSRPVCATGALLVVFGFALRFYSAAVSATFFAVVLAARIHTFFRSGLRMPFSKARIACLMVPLGLCCALFVYDAIAWSAPGWAEWKEFNSYRSQMVDYPMPAYEDVAEELSEMGVSRIDYEFALDLKIGDPEVYTVDVMRELASLSREVDHPPLMGSGGICGSLFFDILSNRAIMIALVVMAACLVFNWKRLSVVERVGVIAILALALLECAFLLYIGRFLSRLSWFIWSDAVLGAGVLSTCLVGERPEPSSEGTGGRLLSLLPLALGVAVAAVALRGIVSWAEPLTPENVGAVVGYNREERLRESELLSYLHEHGDNYYVFDATSGIRYEEAHSLRLVPNPDDRLHVLFFGGWSTGSPYNNAMNSQVKTGNVARALVEDDRVRLITLFEGLSEEMEEYLELHYYDDVRVDLVDVVPSFNDGEFFYVYDFSLEDASHQ